MEPLVRVMKGVQHTFQLSKIKCVALDICFDRSEYNVGDIVCHGVTSVSDIRRRANTGGRLSNDKERHKIV